MLFTPLHLCSGIILKIVSNMMWALLEVLCSGYCHL